jgi:hypothetical protein
VWWWPDYTDPGGVFLFVTASRPADESKWRDDRAKYLLY